ncbi:unnamed protein product [Darwinula stevensoni]|uniref:DUF2428 domain-containing protein n=1 Tax=Darwinula stevensoni TaxID=69355 RepID=A0A7R9A5F0_9CRUS|nr:unnamed protein product [Darwinula stevensoni]CAG0885197.1 unnamed protein product [Darwinula stevensoni]
MDEKRTLEILEQLTSILSHQGRGTQCSLYSILKEIHISKWDGNKQEELKGLLLEIIKREVCPVSSGLLAGILLFQLASPPLESLEESLHSQPCFSQLALIHGYLHNKKLVQTSLPVLARLHSPLVDLCMANSPFMQESFQALSQWLTLMKSIPEKMEVDAIMKVVLCHWEDGNVTSAVIRACIKELCGTCPQAQSVLLARVSLLPWQCLIKFRILAAVVPLMPVTQMMEWFPDLGKGLIESCTTNSSVPHGSDIYKSLISKMDLKQWKTFFLPHMLHALQSPRGIVKQNILIHFLPNTLILLRGSGEELISHLENDMQTRSCILLHWKRNGYHIKPKDLEFLSKAAVHFDDFIRADAFGALCCCKQELLLPTLGEVSLVEDFLAWNLNFDAASFRHSMQRWLKSFLQRLRDSGLANENIHLINQCWEIQERYCVSTPYCMRSSVLAAFCAVVEIFPDRPPGDLALWCLLKICDDPVSEIREKAAQCLRVPLAKHLKPEILEHAQKRSEELLKSLKFNFYESGALLMAIYICSSSQQNSLVKKMMEKVKEDFEMSREDPVKALCEAPIHGWIAALRCCIGPEDMWDIIPLCCNVVTQMLQILSPHSVLDQGVSASFADMGEWLEDLASQTQSHNMRKTKQSQFLLAYAWLNIKECVSLLKDACVGPDIKDRETLRMIGRTFQRLAVQCRHKGVIEAVGVAMTAYCKALLEKGFSNVLEQFLEETLEFVEGQGKDKRVSITRRGAGIPILFLAISSAEPTRCLQRPLGEQTMSNLLKIARIEVQLTPADQQHDLPQVCALHCLEKIVPTLGVVFLEDLFTLCIDCFSSPLWAIRNASLQLFGTIVSRLVGRRKTEADWSMFNLTPAAEFFTAHPRLLSTVAHVLQTHQDIRLVFAHHVSLIPTLGFLSRFSTQVSVLSHLEQEFQDLTEKYLRPLMLSPIAIVRNLSAQCIAQLELPDKRALTRPTCWNAIHSNLVYMSHLLLLGSDFDFYSAIMSLFEIAHDEIPSICAQLIVKLWEGLVMQEKIELKATDEVLRKMEKKLKMDHYIGPFLRMSLTQSEEKLIATVKDMCQKGHGQSVASFLASILPILGQSTREVAAACFAHHGILCPFLIYMQEEAPEDLINSALVAVGGDPSLLPVIAHFGSKGHVKCIRRVDVLAVEWSRPYQTPDRRFAVMKSMEILHRKLSLQCFGPVVMNFLQDDDVSLREQMSVLVTKMIDQDFPLQPWKALQAFLCHLKTTKKPVPILSFLWQYLECNEVEEVNITASSEVLFEAEEARVFANEVLVVKMVGEVFAEVLAMIHDLNQWQEWILKIITAAEKHDEVFQLLEDTILLLTITMLMYSSYVFLPHYTMSLLEYLALWPFSSSEGATDQNESLNRNIIPELRRIRYSKSSLKRASFELYEGAVDNLEYMRFFKQLKMPDTLYSWYLVTELHVWMMMVRVMREEKHGRYLRNCMSEILWQDIEARIKALGDTSSRVIRTNLSEIHEQFQAALFNYDEGVLSSDCVLAGALWRRILSRQVDAKNMEAMVHYVRGTLHMMDAVPSEQLIMKPSDCFSWLRLNGV